MTSSDGAYFGHLREQTQHRGRDISTELLIRIVLAAWLIVLLAGYIATR